MKAEKPGSICCCEPSIFAEGKRCPELDAAVTVKPKCKKYGKGLSWTVSGRVLKCDECLDERT